MTHKIITVTCDTHGEQTGLPVHTDQGTWYLCDACYRAPKRQEILAALEAAGAEDAPRTDPLQQMLEASMATPKYLMTVEEYRNLIGRWPSLKVYEMPSDTKLYRPLD